MPRTFRVHGTEQASGEAWLSQTAVIVDVDDSRSGRPSRVNWRRSGQQIRRWLRPLHLTEDAKNDLVLAVNEAASNAVEHAYTPPTSDDTVRVRFRVEGDAICFEVIDRGTWRTPSVVPAGRGHCLSNARRGIPLPVGRQSEPADVLRRL